MTPIPPTDPGIPGAESGIGVIFRGEQEHQPEGCPSISPKGGIRHNGGEEFTAIPCLNDSDPGMDVIRQLVLRELQGWI